MRAFSQLLDDLVYTRSRNTKLQADRRYLKETPDPDRGIALAALTGTLDIPRGEAGRDPRPGRGADRPRPAAMSRDYVGDMAETISLLWPAAARASRPNSTTGPSACPTRSSGCAQSKLDAPRMLAGMLDHLDASGRYALLKLATGALRVGISARLAKQALRRRVRARRRGGRGGLARAAAAFPELFDWAEGRAGQPTARDVPVFRPFMLAQPLEETQVSPRRLCGGVEMGRDPRPAGPCRRRDPDLQPHRRRHLAAASRMSPRPSPRAACSTASCWCAAPAQGADEHGGAAASFNALQQRLGRKNVSARRCSATIPAFVRLYDILFDGDEDLRAAAAGPSGASGWSASPAARSRAVRPVAADRGAGASRHWRTCAPARATRRSRA